MKENIVLGCPIINDEDNVLNFCLILAKYFIYICKWNQTRYLPPLRRPGRCCNAPVHLSIRPSVCPGKHSGFRGLDSFLAPLAERQRSFSNADLSVVRRRPSSTFQLKAWFLKNCLITFFLFWHVASLGWYQCIVKIWIWLNHPKGHFERSERSNLAPFLLGGNFLKNCLITFSLFMQEASQGGY